MIDDPESEAPEAESESEAPAAEAPEKRGRAPFTPMRRWRIGAALFGQPKSPEHRLAMSEAHRKRKRSEAHRKAISEGRRRQIAEGKAATHERAQKEHLARKRRQYELDLLRAYEAGRMDLYWDVWASQGWREERWIFDSSVVSDGTVALYRRSRRRRKLPDHIIETYFAPIVKELHGLPRD